MKYFIALRCIDSMKNMQLFKSFSSNTRMVLGIESTFDDTGAAVVDEKRNILGEALHVQSSHHVQSRGVNPAVAQALHKEHLPHVVNEAMHKADVTFGDISAIATATRPGLALCLGEGLAYTQGVVERYNLPFIPVHHMEAHLLTARLCFDVDFPFLNLLISGGHCILCLAHGLGSYEILGSALDEPPGAVFDKVARSLKTVERFDKNNRSTGKDLEKIAKSGNCFRYEPVIPLRFRKKSCDFSFSGLQSHVLRQIELSSSDDTADLAAWFQYCILRHVLTQVHRGIIFCKEKNNISTLVVSGGVACNEMLRDGLKNLCETYHMNLLLPPARLCCDNGAMIAWAGMEYLVLNRGICEDPKAERYSPKSPLGSHVGHQVEKLRISIPKFNYFNFDCLKS